MFQATPKARGGKEKDVLVSADLTAATDLLPLDLVRAIWSGLLDCDDADPAVVRIVNLLIGP
jgi:hypothetical protein